MDTVELVSKIDALVEEQSIDTDTALRLILLSQKDVMKRMSAVEATSKANGEYLVHYPSLTWLWVHRKKGTIFTVVAVFLLLYFLLTPLTISDIRHGIMDWAGLPHAGP